MTNTTDQHTHRYEEKERRFEQERARKAAEKEVSKKISARMAAKEYLAGLQDNVFGKVIRREETRERER